MLDPRHASAELTAKEFEVLLHLARNPGLAFSRDDLMDAVRRYPYYSNTATVTVHAGGCGTRSRRTRAIRGIW